MYATFWALVPPIVAILLALITKEVYISLFIGIIFGGFFIEGFNHPVAAVETVFKDGIIGVLYDPYNVGFLVFLVFLGIIVALMNRARLLSVNGRQSTSSPGSAHRSPPSFWAA